MNFMTPRVVSGIKASRILIIDAAPNSFSSRNQVERCIVMLQFFNSICLRLAFFKMTIFRCMCVSVRFSTIERRLPGGGCGTESLFEILLK